MINLLEMYPKPSDLIQSEVKVLEYLMYNPYINEAHADFARHANQYYQRSRSSKNGFEFASHLDLWHTAIGGRRPPDEKANIRLVLASLVQVDGKKYGNITHCLSVFRRRARNEYTILRKFHFDVAVGKEEPAGRLQQHPRFHLQYCGEMLPYMRTLGLRKEQLNQLHPWLSEPRLLYPPMSLALMLDMSLREFPDPASAKFRSTGEWRSIVHEHESAMLRPFFQKCVEVIDSKTGPMQTLVDQFYVS
jgi:hypothetical protein